MMVEVTLIVDVESGIDDMLDREARARRSSSTSQPTTTSTPSPHKSCRPLPSGKESCSGSWKAKSVRASAPTCALCAQTVSSITITAPMSTNGIESASSPPQPRNLEFLKGIIRRIWKVLVRAEKFA